MILSGKVPTSGATTATANAATESTGSSNGQTTSVLASVTEAADRQSGNHTRMNTRLLRTVADVNAARSVVPTTRMVVSTMGEGPHLACAVAGDTMSIQSPVQTARQSARCAVTGKQTTHSRIQSLQHRRPRTRSRMGNARVLAGNTVNIHFQALHAHAIADRVLWHTIL